jgi:hypothetical protein
METSLRCTVAPGQFTGEYAVSASQSNGEDFSLFMDENLVDWDRSGAGGRGEGWLRVEVIDHKGDKALVRLPSPSLEGGQFVTVRSDQLGNGCAPGSRP